jgi:RNAse (barnase) inhibitor barstar
MAAFKDDEENNLDWMILRNGSISLYRNRKYLDDDLQWLRLRGYRVYLIDCGTWMSDESMHTSLEESLSFPAYYGRNFNALKDCLEDLEVSYEGGLVIVLDSYDAYANGAGSTVDSAKTILHILAECSRYFLLRGLRFMTLVQSDDPLMHFEGLGGVSTQWNRREWLNKDRGI